MFRFTIRDLLWLMVVVGMGGGWYAQQRRAEAALAAQRQELKAAAEYKVNMENVLYGEHLTHMMNTRDYSQIIIDILTNENAFAGYRQKYLEQFKMEHSVAKMVLAQKDAEMPSTLEQIVQFREAHQENYRERANRLHMRVAELEAEKKAWQDNSTSKPAP